MSVLNQSGEEQMECPLCMEPLEVDDLHFYPCTCGYQICRFCWNRIREGENGLCPACRKAYPENPADFTPLSQEQVAAIKTEKKAREQKRRNKTLESRKALANVRVVQNNLVFVVGLPVRLADPEILKRQEYFGKYGKIHKVVINQSTTYAGSQGPSASAYVTYVTPADALRAIQGVNNVTLDGRVLKSSLGTTKYCANFMKNQPCPKPDCMYLHELGDSKASFTKEEMHAGLHQVYERKLHLALLQRERPDDSDPNALQGNSGTSISEKGGSKDSTPSNFIATTVVTSSNINVVNNTTSRSKKDSVSNGKEAWPSLGSTPPSDAPIRKQPSPKNTVKSQENSTSSESSSPTEMDEPPQPQAALQQNNRNKEQTDKHTHKNKDKKKHNTDSAKKQKTDSITIAPEPSDNLEQYQQEAAAMFECEQNSYLTNDIDDLQSDRHSLLDNHDLNNSLIEDDSHSLLNDNSNDMMRHRDSHMNMKPQVMNGFGLLDREMYPQMGQSMLEQKEILLRERRSEMMMRNEMLARQHASMMDPKLYMANSSIGLDSANDLLGANYHSNHNMLPPFGMRVDNSVKPNQLANLNSLTTNTMTVNSLSGNHMTTSPLQNRIVNQMGGNIGNHMGVNSLGGQMGHMGGGMSNGMAPPFMMHNQMMQQNQSQMQHSGLVNGFDGPHNNSEGRYLAENMDKFFTDFRQAQQLRALVAPPDDRPRFPHNMLSATSLEMHHKHRVGGNSAGGGGAGAGAGARAGGDGDDDLDFDPFKETQKALAEMMESELMQKSVSSGDSGCGPRPPPGFAPSQRPLAPPAGFNTGSAMYTDWTQMDPAIMSTSQKLAGALGQNALAQEMIGHAPLPQGMMGQSLAQGMMSQGQSALGQMHSQSNMGHGMHPQSGLGQGMLAQSALGQNSLTQQQHELIARFNHLGVALPINGTKMGGNAQMWGGSQSAHKMWSSGRVPLPPGFQAPAQRPAEAIDAN